MAGIFEFKDFWERFSDQDFIWLKEKLLLFSKKTNKSIYEIGALMEVPIEKIILNEDENKIVKSIEERSKYDLKPQYIGRYRKNSTNGRRDMTAAVDMSYSGFK